TAAVTGHSQRLLRQVSSETRATNAVDVPSGSTTATTDATSVIASGARWRQHRLTGSSRAARRPRKPKSAISVCPASEKTKLVRLANMHSSTSSAVRQIGGRGTGSGCSVTVALYGRAPTVRLHRPAGCSARHLHRSANQVQAFGGGRGGGRRRWLGAVPTFPFSGGSHVSATPPAQRRALAVRAQLQHTVGAAAGRCRPDRGRAPAGPGAAASGAEEAQLV